MMQRCTRTNPCVFCGDAGYDMRVIYPETEDTVLWCHKTHASKGDLMTARDGKQYICVVAGYQGDIGVFDLWKEYLSKDEWIEKQKRLNPEWKPTRNSSFRPNKKLHTYQEIPSVSKSEAVTGEAKLLPVSKRDQLNRFFSSITTLEKADEEALLKEWTSSVVDVSHLLDDWPIRTLPCPDKVRFSSNRTYKSPSRKSLISKMYERFGDLSGWPGVYERTGNYFESKPEKERWTFSPNSEYVMFPCYDKDGYLYGWRLKDKFPERRVKEGEAPLFHGMEGYFSHTFDENGNSSWLFYPKDGKPFPVKEKEVYGKPKGKYKTLASVYEKLVDGVPTNSLFKGSRMGSPYSLYTRPGDNMAVVIGTEGEKKAMVANAIKHVPVISIPGVNSFSCIFDKGEEGESLVDSLKQKGMKYFILCYDADKESKETVLNAEKALVQELKNHGIQPFIGSWRESFEKGLDDILLAGIDMIVRPA